ncbi:hypothetical protein CFE70_001570 [Pyrenophora teres f. teres 0-1]
MVRQHGSLEKDEETNQAAWEATRGALIGGTKCRKPLTCSMRVSKASTRVANMKRKKEKENSKNLKYPKNS